ncbi:helix-turn-helix transcriptional regulator [Actinoplanes aureus]|uniref:AAA family ATPase n=1 Tax=Actinoplanes aureus TaxID=2792083 RepID=A0A931C606_9ACTN|nr:LuxR family transcriptional regulator [Actinoplanes aureus]MBG0562849.1 AAA family ATPase [Actinoplanes aureus]
MLTGATVLYGRDPECRKIDELLAGLRAGAGGSLLFTGGPGIGKSALLNYAADRAGATDVLVVHGAEAESDLPFAGLHALLAPVRHLLPSIPEHQCAALAAGLGSGPPPDSDPYAVAAGTLSLLTAADRGTGLLLVDDLHLLDQVSRRAVLFVARRATGAGVGVIATMDGGADGDHLEQHRLDPLDDDEAEALLRATAGTQLSAPMLRRLLRVCGGLPLALVEAPAVLGAEELGGAVPLPDPLPVGPRVLEAVRRRAAELTAEHWAALVVVAAAGDAGLQAIRAVLTELDLPAEALEAAEAAGVLRCHGNEVTFTDPLVRCAAYQLGELPYRRRVHAAFAAVTTGARRARHLGVATLGLDEGVAGELERAAAQPYAAHAMSQAARLLECAAELTGDAAARARRSMLAAECWQLAGYPERAARIGDEVAHRSDDVRVRAETQALLARGERVRTGPEPARRTLRREAVRVRALDPDRAAVMLLATADAEALAGDPGGALAAVSQAAGLRRSPAGPPAEVLTGRRAAAVAATGELVIARELWSGCRSGIETLTSDGALPVGWRGDLWLWYPVLLLRLGELAIVTPILEELVFEARRREIDGLLAGLLAVQAELHARTGSWDDAQAEAAEAVRRAGRTGQGAYEAAARLCQARLAAARGHGEECREQLGRIRRLATGLRLGSLVVPAEATEGLLALSLGEDEAAYARLEGAARLAEVRGSPDFGRIPWVGDLTEAAVRSGRSEEARGAIAGVAARGMGSVPLRAVLNRCEGLVNPERATELFRAAAGSGEPFEAARARLLLGETLASQGCAAEAERALRQARDTFVRLAARPWADRARQALSREPGTTAAPTYPSPSSSSSASPPRWRVAGLTTQELRVADLVGRGATNRETAKELFLSPKTVEFHLRSIYRKLGLRSRAELAHIVGRDR